MRGHGPWNHSDETKKKHKQTVYCELFSTVIEIALIHASHTLCSVRQDTCGKRQ
jgi:hypothetical protein